MVNLSCHAQEEAERKQPKRAHIYPFPITVDIPGVRYVDETEVDETPHQPKEHTFHASAPGELARAPEFTRKRPKTPKKQSACVTLPPIGKEKAADSKAAG